jgi:hypothetical protein
LPDGSWRFRTDAIGSDAYEFTRDMVRNLLQTAVEVQRLLAEAGRERAVERDVR